MDIEELNRQMSFFQNEYNQNQSTQPIQHQSINFPPPLETPMPTTQVKRPTRTTGSYRNEINDKMAQMKMNQPMFPAPNQFQSPSPVLAQATRNNSRYQNPDHQNPDHQNPDHQNPDYRNPDHQNPDYRNPDHQVSMVDRQHIQNIPNIMKQNYQQEYNNPLSSYFQQNYSTLNGIQNPQKQPINTSLEHFNIPTNMSISNNTNNTNNTHEGGQSFVNPNNLPIYAQPPNQTLNHNLQPGNGYTRMDEKRIDYRQNMNSKVGDFIFDNPNAARYNPQQVAHNPNGYARDTRMVIQDSSKDIYRQEANSRMAQYSPLARASHVPIDIANMSVNDFYANMNPSPSLGANHGGMQKNYQNAEDDARAVLNSRIGAYSPLAKAIPLEKPRVWEATSVNKTNPLVAHEELPIISH